MLNIVIFTGGNGNSNLIKHIKDLPYINLTLLINGYDDGLSTGTIRKAAQGMLGPSDFRKNFTYLLDNLNSDYNNLKLIFEHRISNFEVEELLHDRSVYLDSFFLKYKLSDKKHLEFLKSYLEIGLNCLLAHTQSVDLLNDFSVGNIIICGLYEAAGDFNIALDILTKNFDLSAKLVNISKCGNSKLVAIENNGNLLLNESLIVNYNNTQPLSNFLIVNEDDLNSKLIHELGNLENPFLYQTIPDISEQAQNALLTADLIIFGTGTLFSSLLPSFRICSKFFNDVKGKKVLIINNKYDNDINNISLEGYIELISREVGDNSNDFFKSIIIDKDSEIKRKLYNGDFSNLFVGSLMDLNNKHHGGKLWESIISSTELNNGFYHVNIITSNKTDLKLKSVYEKEIIALNLDCSNSKVKYSFNSGQNGYTHTLYLDSVGYVSLSDIELWIKIMRNKHIDVIFGSRFDSRMQLIMSFKNQYTESYIIYLLSLIASNMVTFVYFFRFQKVLPDPLSGVYFVNQKASIHYENLPRFLKALNKMELTMISFPVSYRIFSPGNFIKKTITVFLNIVRLYV
jgi:2-phospho-L-lactate transferase/gluconeogenesis factor (CofD/UPF0052 family)